MKPKRVSPSNKYYYKDTDIEVMIGDVIRIANVAGLRLNERYQMRVWVTVFDLPPDFINQLKLFQQLNPNN